MILYVLMLIPLVFAALVAIAPAAQARTMALLGTFAALAASIYSLYIFNWNDPAAFQFATSFPWLAQLGVNLTVGADSVSMMLIALTALLGPICVIASTSAITHRLKTYYAALLILQTAMTGVFASRDIILFYVCFEFTLIPMFVLISLFGSTNRKHASIKFFLYTFTGSVITLAGLVYVAWFNANLPVLATAEALAATLASGGTAPGPGLWTFDIATLEQAARQMNMTQQAWVLLALMAGFAVKVPLFPVHTWLPLAHTEAPTAGSVILAGVLLKLGTYGIFRFALTFVPVAMAEYAPLIATLSIIGILYGGLICWVQTDVKKLVAYSSVAHLGFCILGMAALNNTGITGSILYMINHGLSTGALFLCIGMIYERYHTRSMKELGGLAAKMPVWSTFMVFFAMASVGLPGLNGFVSEFLCLFGAFQASSAWGSGLWGSSGEFQHIGSTIGNLGPWYAAIAGLGMVVAAMYLLLMVGKVVWGPLVLPHGHDSHDSHAKDSHGHGKGENHAHLPTDLNAREIGVLVPLAVLCVVLGIYPKPFLDVLEPPVSRIVQVIAQARSAGFKMVESQAPATVTPSISAVDSTDTTANSLLFTASSPAPVTGGASK